MAKKNAKPQVKKTGKKASGVAKSKKAKVPKVIIKVKATYNNTIAVATDYDGNVIAQSSCGLLGFAGSRKSTVYAATMVGEDVANKAIQRGATEAEVVVQGIGNGRQATVKGVRAAGLRITLLADHTAVPHGGVKPRRKPNK